MPQPSGWRSATKRRDRPWSGCATPSRRQAQLLDACTRARQYRAELDRLSPRRARETEALEGAGEALQLALEQRDAARGRLRAAEQERDQLAQDLSRASAAFESVARKVGLYRAAMGALDEARVALPDRDVQVETLTALLAECEREWRQALQDLASSEQALETAETRRARFDELLGVVRRLAGESVAPERAGAEAARLDRVFRDLSERIERARDLPQRIEQAQRDAQAQSRLRRRLQPLIGACGPLDDAAQLHQAHGAQLAERRALEQRQAALRERCVEHRAALKEADGRIATLEGDLKDWRRAQALRAKLAPSLDQPLDNAAALETLAGDLAQRGEHLVRRLDDQDRDRKRLIEQAEQLEFSGGHLDESLVGLADALDGRLLAELFDDCPADQAARVEARLGPLHSALLVESPARAARQAAKQPRRPEHIWLLAASGAGAQTPAGETIDDSELVRAGDAWRLSRRPQRPVVGRAAREAEIRRLRDRADALEQAREETRREREQLRTSLEGLNRLRLLARWLDAPSPQGPLEAERGRRARRSRELQADETARTELLPRIQQSATRCEDLAVCLPDAALLDQQDWSAALLRLRRERDEIKAHRARLEQAAPDLERLREGFLELQQAPPDDHYLHALRQRRDAASQRLDDWGIARQLLKHLDDCRDHFRFADQVPLLEDRQGALATLEVQLRQQRQAIDGLVREQDATQARLDQASAQRNQADAELKATVARMQALEEQLAATGEDGSAETLAEAQQLHARTKQETDQADNDERGLLADLAVARKDVKHAVDAEAAARKERRKTLLELRPIWRNWLRLRREAARLDLLARLLDQGDHYQGMAPPNVMERAAENRASLEGVLKQADGGPELLAALAAERRTGAGEGGAALRDLHAWLRVHRLLEQSIPRDIVHCDDPEEALVQINTQLTLLRERLEDQERALHQSTESIANSIQVRIRQEESRIRKLNQGLARVRFGSIRGVRIHLEHQRLMRKLLDAMRLQPDLFEQDDPLEDVMARVYTHIGGGQVKGEHLLDYRQYISLSVQVQRLSGDAWSEARAGALSTGESIGVGAAVLVVVLDAWEQQAALLKGRKAGQALRFLFLDEANRLSPDSLDTLTEFCHRMQVQLLAAAPAADRARRGHVYRLARRKGEHGEEVIVRGRRMREAPA